MRITNSYGQFGERLFVRVAASAQRRARPTRLQFNHITFGSQSPLRPVWMAPFLQVPL